MGGIGEVERKRGFDVCVDIAALHFLGTRWNRCITAPRGDPGHSSTAKFTGSRWASVPWL